MLTRRQVIVGGAATGLAATLGCKREPVSAADRETQHQQAAQAEYDLCIIGSGFAGAPIALRAAEAGLRTIVVEAGHRPRAGQAIPEHQEKDFGHTQSGPVKWDIIGTRLIDVGGTSDHWGGVATRLWPAELRMASTYGRGVDWPVTYDELVPYYCQAEKFIQVRGWGPVADAEPPRTCAYPHEVGPGPTDAIFEIEGHTCSFVRVARSARDGVEGRPVRLDDEEIPRFEKLDKGTLLDNHQVVRLVTTDGKRVAYAEARALDGTIRKITANRFIVAAGGIESARLLLLSKSQWFPEGLGNNHDQVGRYFNAHPSWELGFKIDAELFEEGFYRTYSLADAYRRQNLNGAHYAVKINERLLRSTKVKWQFQPEIEPSPNNRVTLSETKDRFGVPLPDLFLEYSRRDEATIARGRATLQQIALAATNEPKSAFRWRAHPAGAVRMGATPEVGVLDPNLRVFGVDNVYVTGACTFPNSGTPNPTVTLVALSLRLADHLIAAA